jgi:hypothetical protein
VNRSGRTRCAGNIGMKHVWKIINGREKKKIWPQTLKGKDTDERIFNTTFK